MAITGNVTTQAGESADLVRIFRWPDNKLETTAVPDAAGDWSTIVGAPGEYGITYTADGCQPITHGPYYVEGSDLHWDKVVALLHFDGDYVDQTGRIWSQTGEFLTSSDNKVFGSASAYFPPTGLRGLVTPSTPDLNLGSDDFTVECCINPRIQSRQINICGLYGYSFNRRSWDFLYEAGKLKFRMDNNGSAPATDVVSASMGTGMLNNWTHVAVTRHGNVFRMFFNGVIVNQSTYNISAFENLIDPVVFGTSGPNIVNSWDGYIDELRITKGVARYTENFTLPTGPFPDSGPA